MSVLAFKLPPALEAHEPPPRRDAVKLLVAHRAEARIGHHVFADLPELLSAGDLLVVNVSATLPAAVPGWRADFTQVRIHFSTRAPRLDPSWRVVEVRSADGRTPQRARAGEVITLQGGESLELVAPYASGARLMLSRFDGPVSVEEYLERSGEPIRYGYVRDRWPLCEYQNVYATTPGSAEMPSAGRPFTTELITRLVAHGVLVAPITLHTGVSSPERHEPPFPEQYEIPETTARIANTVRRAGGRVIAVGTTVVRALEAVARPDGTITPGSGWTNLVIGPGDKMRAVEGLITGWHEPNASHLLMLEAIARPDLLVRSYSEALEHRYLWHEFGDSHLIL